MAKNKVILDELNNAIGECVAKCLPKTTARRAKHRSVEIREAAKTVSVYMNGREVAQVAIGLYGAKHAHARARDIANQLKTKGYVETDA